MLLRDSFKGPWAGLPVAWTAEDEFDETVYRGDVASCCKAKIPGIYTEVTEQDLSKRGTEPTGASETISTVRSIQCFCPGAVNDLEQLLIVSGDSEIVSRSKSSVLYFSQCCQCRPISRSKTG